jgi:hypothetical protein
MEIITQLNGKGFFVNLDYLREMIRSTIREGESLRKELNQIVELYGAKIDICSTADVIRFINTTLLSGVGAEGSKITNESLDRWFEQTKDVFFLKLKQYRRCRGKYKKIAIFTKSLSLTFDEWGNKSVQALMESNLKAVSIYPEFTVNMAGGITMSNPAMPFSTIEIMKLLGFNVGIRFPSTDRMIGFLEKYEEIIWHFDWGMHTLISGSLLYVGMVVSGCNIIPFSGNEIEAIQLAEEFRREYQSTHSSDVIFFE